MARTVLVTGGTSGLGLELARRWRAAGDRVLVVGRRTPDDPADFLSADLATADGPRRIVDFVAECGPLDLLVHNAAVGWIGPIPDQPADSIDEVLDVNVRSPIVLTRLLLPHLRAGTGCIAFVGSVTAATPSPDFAVYAASKAAVEGFARSLRVELAGRLRVVCVSPGAIATPMHERLGTARLGVDPERFPSTEAVGARVHSMIEQGRNGATDWTGRLIRFAGRHFTTFVESRSRPRLEWRSLPERPFRTSPTRGEAVEEAASGRQSYAVPVPNISSDDLCVVTGAADGIGRALAEAFARRGRHVVGIDVDSARAEVAEASLRTAGLRATYLVADVANAGGRESILRSLCSLGRIRTLVHNAGVNRFGRFEEMDFVSLHRILDVNLAAPLQLNRLLLEGACWSDRAEFVFIASLSCFVGYPGASVYAATKDGLASYAGGLAASGRARGLRVLTVFPGPTRTEHARRNSPDNTREHRRMPPEELAQRIIHAVEAGSRNLVPGVGNRAAAFFGEWFPSTASRLLAKSLRVR